MLRYLRQEREVLESHNYISPSLPNSPSLAPQQSCSIPLMSLMPPVDLVQHLHILPVLKNPELETALQWLDPTIFSGIAAEDDWIALTGTGKLLMQGTKVLKLQWQQNAILMCHRDSPGGKESSCLPIVTQAGDQAEDDLLVPPNLDWILIPSRRTQSCLGGGMNLYTCGVFENPTCPDTVMGEAYGAKIVKIQLDFNNNVPHSQKYNQKEQNKRSEFQEIIKYNNGVESFGLGKISQVIKSNL
ncbi:hypothetical protein TURU_086304 [Turdus rufiventris]|nr:hypothetical protein TURU_086304 [Turdus rufiventris]